MAGKVNISPDIASLSSYNGDITCTKGEPVEPEEESKIYYQSVPFLQLYKYATGWDKFNIFIATILCTITGICNTVLSYTFGEATGTIVDYVYIVGNTTYPDDLEEAEENLMKGLNWFVWSTCSLGAATLVFTYIATLLFNYSALRQTYKIRQLFLAKVLDQDIPWYDVNQTGDFASRVADDLKKIEEGIGEKVSTFLFYEMTFISSILQGLIMGWKLALICMISFPIATISMGFVAWISSKLAKQEMDAYGEAGAIAEETLSSIRTVVAFGGQEKEQERYDDLLLFARNNNIKRSLFNGISNSIMWFFAYASYAMSFYFGVKFILEERHLPEEEITYTPGNMITIFFSILTGTWYFGMASPFIETFGIAKGAASKIFYIISTTPTINASKNNGIRLGKLQGNIVFKNVQFHYPSRPDVKILRGLNLTIKSGETVALVGSSGCGKSTCIQLIQRYYDPVHGEVLIDGKKVNDFDLTWLRSKIGVVGQEPVLFEATIAENIKFGNPKATEKDIIRAAKKANAHVFISTLPQAYDTMVGERGAQLSGGQKQRIAIARALIREPSILLLDEATSALDTNSEAIVQAALDAASHECTTIIVAHRLSTVRKADRIVVISEGKVLEQGSHAQLVELKGAYYQLVTAQMSDQTPDDSEDQEVIEDKGIVTQQSIESNTKSLSFLRPDGIEIAQEFDESKSSGSPLWAVMKFNSPEWWIITIGCISSVVTGAGIPVYSIVFGDVVGVLAADDPVYIQEQTNKFSLYFLYIGIATGVATLFQIYMFGIAGEKLTMRLRSRMYKAMLSQEMAWFDNKDNGVGSLCARLSGEAASVQGATGQRIGTMLNALSTIGIATGVAFYFDWRVALVALCFAPPIVLSIYMEQKIVSKESAGNHKSLQRSTKIAVEGISNIRTVASLGCENIFFDNYMNELIPYQNAAKRNTHFRGMVYGVSRSLMFFAYAAALYYGAILVKQGRADYTSVFIVSEGLITSSWSLANALAFTPNFQKGVISAGRIFELLSRVPKVQSGSDDVNEKWVKGDIEYEKVYFSYPNRPSAPILRGLNLSVLQGKMVALVGPSGCGKSTIVQLLERFYDPIYGRVTTDGKDIRKMNLSALRSHLGIVSQEPSLFSKTIAENIAYGDNSRTVTREEIIEAAKNANIHNFITSLPLGYDTKLGDKGTQLSGGQKQRVAIARALVRNPKVLLLDEATSALDAESEKVVQEALDKAKVGRTCISIAHRLTTIQDADVICVINHGRVAEIGSHSELLKLKGLYYNLHSLQSGKSYEPVEPEEQSKIYYPSVPFLQLYKYATGWDKFNIFIATIFCTITGICNTVLSYTFGEATGIIVDYVYVVRNTTFPDDLQEADENLMKGLNWFLWTTCSLGAATFVFTYIATLLFNYSALRQTYKIRQLFLAKVLDQDIPWYDVNQTGDFASRVADDLKKIEEGIGEKVSTFIFYEMTFISSILQGLIMGWKLALICMISLPIATISMGFVAWISSKLAKQEMDAYGEAGAIAEETLGSIRTVVAFGGQEKEQERYDDLLLFARDNNIKRSLFNGISNSIMWFFAYASYAMSFYFGVKFILEERHLPDEEITYTPGNMITVFFSILIGMWFFGMASPFIETFGIAKGAASKIFYIISITPTINASKNNGIKLGKLEGNIIFNNVEFHYPSRPDVKILRGLNLTIKSGETVALVGSSGCGKSTCIQLIQRYYDPVLGEVLIDGKKVTEFDLTWLRSKLGVVGQEPVLFEATIAENIKLGNPKATEKDIVQAAKKANAHVFIRTLPQAYNTMVGERGAQLSGGQKQRIAIARALIREPSILLLDEATSALDTNSEAIVQAALDAASHECTTIIVAHRLSTVRKADRIVVISEGKVLEQGSHDQLVELKGAYYQLVTSQMSDQAPDDSEDQEENKVIVTQQSLESNTKSVSFIRPDGIEIAQEFDESKSSGSPLWAVMKFNSPEWWIIMIGCISSVITGAGIPVYSIVFGNVIGVLAADDPVYVQEQTNKFSLYFLYIGIATGVATLFQIYMFGIAGEKLTMRLRSRMYKAMLSQEMSWFDNKDNGVGSLCARLSGEAASVQGATGQRIGSMLNALSTIGIATGVAFYFNWKLALVAMCFAPPIVLSVYLEQKIVSKESAGNHKSLQRSTKIAVEGISNIRTVASLGCENIFFDNYMNELIPYQKAAKRNTHYRGMVYGVSRSLIFFGYAAALYYGAILVKQGRTDYTSVFVVSESLITSSWSLASALAFTPNFQKGVISAGRIFELLSRVPKVQSGSDDINEKWGKGDIEYEKVYFSYPSRPSAPILTGLNLSVLQGKMVALVGPSGCGKSTIVQLLERFYDPIYGRVTTDGKDIRNLNLSALRSHLGIVSQEPSLFSKTIADNIAYGDNSRTVTREEIIEAAKNANIHNFITSLPLGYDTKLGDKGTQLSGGQKQRVAIARALVRNPKVLLLDEATSALDAESEKVVQEALDKAKVGRTCISIAHRLTTIQDADVICVINHGRVAEIGSHSELLRLKGLYYNLHSLQSGTS